MNSDTSVLAAPKHSGKNSKLCERCNKEFFKRERDSFKQWESRRFCSVGCSNKAVTNTELLEIRFWRKVKKQNTGCWLWAGAKNPVGYGRIWQNGTFFHAHRVSWVLHFGEIPEGLCVLHACDNPSCVNPYHLMLGTQRANILDATRKGRMHELNKKTEKKMINKHVIVGRLGQDVELRYTKNGKAVANYSVATSEKWKNANGEIQEKTTWHDVVCFDKLAKISSEYLSKGSLVYIEGPNIKEQWEDKDGNKRVSAKLRAREMKMLDAKQTDAASSESGFDNRGVPAPNGVGDDVPF